MQENNNEHRVKRRNYLKTSAGIAGASLAGCLGNVGSSGSGLTEINLAITHSGLWDTGIVTFEIPKQKGFFEEEGLKATKTHVTAEGGIRSLISGDTQISLSSGIMGAYASHRDGVPIRIVANEWSAGSDLVYYSKSESKYNTLQDCNDARIGFSQPSSSTHMVTLGAIDYANLDNAKAVTVGGPPDANTALVTENIDLAWTVPPFFLEGINGGKYHKVFTGDQIPPFNDMTIRVHTALDGWLSDNSDTARAYFRAYQKSLDWSYNNKRKAAELWGEVIDFDNYDILTQALEENYVKVGLQLDRLRNLDASNELAVEFGFIESPLSEEELEEITNLNYLPEHS